MSYSAQLQDAEFLIIVELAPKLITEIGLNHHPPQETFRKGRWLRFGMLTHKSEYFVVVNSEN